ncbi:BLUF domain-containing protein [Oceanicaulis sp. MMSF_3324]|uniref:BLUF domain-containing protein n=1 Tax=Oceanicaulis sp. MMSF_3324 TaxID=3046702 RepID=UPI00273FAB8A|nr:BLUF domain-containing protein [Oceanicaulis sp. MMSF_3324]
MTLTQIIYTSFPTFPVRAGWLTGPLGEIVRAGRDHNARNQISGILGVEVNRFFQIIEGPASRVEETFERIRYDTRHFDVRLRSSRDIAVRTFQDWSVGFAARAFLPASEPTQIDFDAASPDVIIKRGQILRRYGVIAEAGLDRSSASGS